MHREEAKSVRTRLQEAALELYREHGYDQTTTAQIAERVGVTERTFFRHFPDKREVLFDGDRAFGEHLANRVREAAGELGPLQVLLETFASFEEALRKNRPFTEPREEVIAATPALQERADAKIASLTVTLASALEDRGVEGKTARLAARTGMAVFSHAANCWRETPSLSLKTHLDNSFRLFQDLATDVTV